MSGQLHMCTHLYYSSWARPYQPTSACPLQHGAGAEYSDPATNHGPNLSADMPGRHEQPRRPVQKRPGGPWRCHGIARPIVRWQAPPARVGFRGISRGPLGAPGLAAVVVRDALACLLIGLVHGWLLGRCTLPPAPCCRGHADVGWHGLAQLE